ncbi:MAG: MrcB family domain-containing protein, partial [Bacteroidota bacterium]
MNEYFTWVNTHKELVAYLQTKENSQKELIELLKSIGVQPFKDKSTPSGYDIELEEIDPFTFFCYIYKYGSKKRLQLLQAIAQKLQFENPTDDKGIPSAQAQKVWLFPYKFARKNNEIPRLWRFFNKALNDTITDSDFDDILTINSVGRTKITEVLFYISPEKFLPINGPIKSYIESEYAISTNFKSFTEYRELLTKIEHTANIPFYKLSYQAWEWNNGNNSKHNISNYSQQLLAFLEQAKTDNLKTKHFIQSYKGTEVKVSFGQGVSARIPWISFLKKPNTTSKGIYPVYLYYKELNTLILAYGVSETNNPRARWDIQNPKTISEYFYENGLGKPDRYGNSFIYKVYDVENLPDEEVINNDLDNLITFYLNNMVQKRVVKDESKLFDRQSFTHSLENAGLLFNSKLVLRFISSLLTKPFVILSGLSGSGKTKLAQAFVQWICQNDSQYCILPVGADWTNREPLLGYPNALKPDEYIKPDNQALDVIINANNHPELPHFLILDEMNMSHVERYFADFLSVMESKGEISLYAEGTVNNGVPSKL